MGVALNIEYLLDVGVVLKSGADEIRVTDGFLAEWHAARDEIIEGRENLLGHIDGGEYEQLVSDIISRYPDIAACLYVIGEWDPELEVESRIKYSLVASRLVKDPPRSEGAPEQFWPIHGNELELYQTLYQKGVAYVWKEECEPCDRMKVHFNQIFDKPEDELMLIAIYGPAYEDYLLKNYSVGIAPTTLLLTSDRVDLRFVGSKERAVVKTEIETLREL